MLYILNMKYVDKITILIMNIRMVCFVWNKCLKFNGFT